MSNHRSPVIRFIVAAISIAGLISLSSTCHGGGFFRRVPEVGEWARYDLTLQHATHNPRIDREISFDSLGSLLLKCVGTEVIDEVQYVWLEARIEVESDGTYWAVVKVLVPSEHVIKADLADHISRGWVQSFGEESRQLDLTGRGIHDEEAGRDVIYMAFEDARKLEAISQERTVTLDGQDLTLTECELGGLPTFAFNDATLSGGVTWWPHDELAFGIAAAEHVQVTIFTDSGIESRVTTQIDLVETGTDAVSELPEHN